MSRQHEVHLYDYYGWPPYWNAATWGVAAVPPPGVYSTPGGPGWRPVPADKVRHEVAELEAARRDPHLRSGREVTGYHIKATDDSVGHVEDLLIDEDGWAIRYLLVDTRNWLPGRKVLVATGWASRVSWPDRDVSLDMTSHQIKTSPQYDADELVHRDYEDRLHRHYGRAGYWA